MHSASLFNSVFGDISVTYLGSSLPFRIFKFPTLFLKLLPPRVGSLKIVLFAAQNNTCHLFLVFTPTPYNLSQLVPSAFPFLPLLPLTDNCDLRLWSVTFFGYLCSAVNPEPCLGKYSPSGVSFSCGFSPLSNYVDSQWLIFEMNHGCSRTSSPDCHRQAICAHRSLRTRGTLCLRGLRGETSQG